MLRLCASLLLVSLVAHAAAETPRPDIEMNAEGEVQIAPDGSVTDYRLNNAMAPKVAQLIDQRVRGWHFEPILVDGKAVVAKTSMHIHLKGTPSDGDNYRIQITDIRFGGPHKSSKFTRPNYPRAAAMAHVGGRVLMCVKMDDTGTVTGAEPIRTSLDFHTDSNNLAEHYRQMFETASADAVRSWHFDITETIDGKKVGGVAIIPFAFNIRGQDTKEGVWKAFESGPTHDVSSQCAQRAAARDQMADLADGQPESLTSRFKLVDDASGKSM